MTNRKAQKVVDLLQDIVSNFYKMKIMFDLPMSIGDTEEIQ